MMLTIAKDNQKTCFKNKPLLVFYVSVLITVFSCHNNTLPPQFTLIESSGIDFENKNEFKIDYNIFNYRNYYNGGGVAIGDLNNDGLPDIFFTANQIENALYLNRGNFKFENITLKAGLGKHGKSIWSTGVTMVDINNDGWLDIYICNAGNIFDSNLRANQLFINNHNLTFTEQAEKYGLQHKYYTTQANFFDFDLDGDLDCFMIDNSPIPVNTINNMNARHIRAENSPIDDVLRYGGDHLFRNDNGFFNEVSEAAGIHGTLISLGLGATVADLNQDGYPDIYVSNDFFERDYLYINQKNGSFKDDIEQCTQHLSLASMGSDIADINNDGYADIFTTDMLPLENYRLKTTTAFDNYDVYKLKLDQGFYHQFMQNTLQLNTGNNNFKEISQYAGIEASDWSWGALMFDADNDGYNDIYVCNGIKHDLTNQDFLDFLSNDIIKQMVTSGVKDDVKKIIEKMPITPIINKMYHNQGDFTFKDVATNWGMQLPSFSNGAAYADLDNDGDLDLIVNNLNAKAFVFKNNAEKNSNNHFFKCYLHFNPKNKFAIGAKIKIFQDNHIYFREQFPTRGFQSSVDYGVVTGIGTSKKIDSVIIEWPNLQKSVYKSIKADSVYQFSYQTESSYKIIAAPQLSKPHFTEIENNFPVMHENDHIDFYIERGIPKMLSKESPKSAVADVNRDGLLDIYITNTNKTNGGLYLQQKNTTFKKMVQPCFANDKHLEETTVTFFDANGDGFADLFIGCGGNHRAPQEGYYSIKLFLNNGKGQFLEQIDALPQNTNNISTCLAFDYDNDGDLDLFIGSRSVPLIYGQKPTNLLLNNNGHGVFKDVSSQEGLALQNIGMITSAQFGNIFNNKKQLVIVGEWMQPHFFEFDKHVFNKVKTNLDSCSGWWQHLEIADMNNDGHLDLIIGNIGENFYLRPTNHSSVILWLKDFDENGTIDKIITKQIEGNDYTVLLKRDLDQQLPSLKKQNLKFESFARKTMQELFNPNQLAQTEKLYFNYGASIVAYNQGHYDFKIEKLPPDIQFSSLNAFVIQDFNGDGLLDLLSAGNQLYFVPQFGRLDGSYGSFVLNQNGLLTNVVSEKESGLHIIGQINDIKQISSSPQPLFIFLRNNLKPVVLKYSY